MPLRTTARASRHTPGRPPSLCQWASLRAVSFTINCYQTAGVMHSADKGPSCHQDAAIRGQARPTNSRRTCRAADGAADPCTAVGRGEPAQIRLCIRTADAPPEAADAVSAYFAACHPAQRGIINQFDVAKLYSKLGAAKCGIRPVNTLSEMCCHQPILSSDGINDTWSIVSQKGIKCGRLAFWYLAYSTLDGLRWLVSRARMFQLELVKSDDGAAQPCCMYMYTRMHQLLLTGMIVVAPTRLSNQNGVRKSATLSIMPAGERLHKLSGWASANNLSVLVLVAERNAAAAAGGLAGPHCFFFVVLVIHDEVAHLLVVLLLQRHMHQSLTDYSVGPRDSAGGRRSTPCAGSSTDSAFVRWRVSGLPGSGFPQNQAAVLEQLMRRRFRVPCGDGAPRRKPRAGAWRAARSRGAPPAWRSPAAAPPPPAGQARQPISTFWSLCTCSSLVHRG